MPDLCPHGDIAAACLECLEGAPAKVAPNRGKPLGVSPAFTSRYDGWCPECEERWEQGEQIVKTEDGSYCHQVCAR